MRWFVWRDSPVEVGVLWMLESSALLGTLLGAMDAAVGVVQQGFSGVEGFVQWTVVPKGAWARGYSYTTRHKKTGRLGMSSGGDPGRRACRVGRGAFGI